MGILRRCLSRSGILRNRVVSAVDGESAGNRMMSSGTRAPWLMLPAAVDGSGNMAYTFQCLAKKEEFTYKSKIIDKNLRLVGSSHGWLALQNGRKLLLSNPVTDEHIRLPALPSPGVAERVILSSSPEEKGCLAFISLHGKAAFCWMLESNEWTFFGKQHEYDALVYSSRHKRLFCLTREYTNLEGWDFESTKPRPRLDWAIQRKMNINFGNLNFHWQARDEFKKYCEQVKYLVCAEEEEYLYLVVRHVNPAAGPYGSIVDTIVFSQYNGRHFSRTPYKTVDFDVYKIDWKRGEVIHMEDSLEGLAFFVGTNHSFASKAPGVKRDSVYFTDENRLVEATRMARINYGGHDNGIFDYNNKDFSSCSAFYPIEYHKIRKVLPLPLWFTPTFL